MEIVLIDALNLAHWGGKTPSLRLPLTLVAHLLTQERQATLYFDASARYKLADQAALYAELMQFAEGRSMIRPAQSELCVEVPKGISADREMLKQANRQGACIVSRDKFRDHRKRFRRLIDDPARLFSGTVSNDRLLIPGLAVDVALPASAAAAWSELRRHIECRDHSPAAKEASAAPGV